MVIGRITLKDVAREAGVHTSTASRALNPQTQSVVNPETVARVLEVAQRLGYRPHPLARGLRTNQTMTVGMVIPDVENPLFGPIIAGVEHRLGTDGYSLLIANTDPRDDSSLTVIDALAERRVDGMIIASASRVDEHIRRLHDQGLPVVQVNRMSNEVEVPAIVGDDHAGIGLVMEHLVELGHRRIGHVAGPGTFSTGLGRREAFLEWAGKLGVHEAPIEEAESFRMMPGYRVTRRLIERNPDLTAIVAANDLLALGAYQAVSEAGFTIGQGISVTGYNDVPFMQFVQPPMTAVRVPYRKMGVEAASVLLEMIADSETVRPGAVWLTPTLSVRESTARPRS
ncbi:MAG: LacI family transcriptional regulator [Acidimicrobiia bacterium]|nr:LacI family transcriptional regulator [Acidimicrobiia bacterium]MDH4306989.1 LacI family transcriptional regulator [Acidimicrobiia bacterium]MDH5293886.1 LacI family transcriptional regulator [Acidimicrobiia bacterium]MDH5521526.1 LacI family transcriptional regulator [Acidimicrobiia bacterium]